ncbi:MAG: DUF302 domain-containing protein [Gammaproteobacteria bacterium]|jgi:uncharacterized protein (DUF302 family)
MQTTQIFIKQFFITVILIFSSNSILAADKPFVVDLEKTVIKMPIDEGISIDDAVESMKLRANILNIKLVAELPLSKQIKAMGKESRRIGIYQFCDALTAKKMVEYDMNFAAYLPCRIAVVEDPQGKGWLIMMNMEMLLNNPKLNKQLKAEAEKVWKDLNGIMKAGASGAL